MCLSIFPTCTHLAPGQISLRKQINSIKFKKLLASRCIVQMFSFCRSALWSAVKDRADLKRGKRRETRQGILIKNNPALSLNWKFNWQEDLASQSGQGSFPPNTSCSQDIEEEEESTRSVGENQETARNSNNLVPGLGNHAEYCLQNLPKSSEQVRIEATDSAFLSIS